LDSSPTIKEVRKALSEFAVSDTTEGVTLFAVDMGTYLIAIVGVLYAPWLLLKVIAGIIAGIKMANLATIGHDAAHNVLTSSRTLNKYIGILSFTPSLFNYRLWIYDHHNLHHHNTNELHPDSYTPLSLQAYNALSAFQKAKYRFYRSTSLWSFGMYYIFERWPQAKLIPRSRMPKHVRKAAWPYSIYLGIYFVSYMALLASAPLYSDTSAFTAIICGFVIPFYVYMSLYAFTVYVQHTHPNVAWFSAKPDRNGEGRQDYISVQLRFSPLLSWATHYVYDHAAHHAHIGIPCYHLAKAQVKLNEMIGNNAISDQFSLKWLRSVQNYCKLYDFENKKWLDFNGDPMMHEKNSYFSIA
jgi:acyl-lipid omega-6 desaturase (Delta-12 desaturase)